jgi:putative FmdB family regulatory protein
VPVYQYVCTECSEPLELRQSFTDDALTECPACAGRLRKVLNAVGVVFKGSGFYRTDSRTDAKAAAADSKAEATPSTGANRVAGSGDKGGSSRDRGGNGSGDKGTGSKSTTSTASTGSSKVAAAS